MLNISSLLFDKLLLKETNIDFSHLASKHAILVPSILWTKLIGGILNDILIG